MPPSKKSPMGITVVGFGWRNEDLTRSKVYSPLSIVLVPAMPAETDKKDKDAQNGHGEEEVSRVIDPRISFFEDCVCKTLKIKNDKWKKMVANQENWYEAFHRLLISPVMSSHLSLTTPHSGSFCSL